VLFSRDTNERLLDFSSDLSVYIYQILQFLTFNSEAKPYPFAVWPNGPEDLESLDVFDNVEVGPEVGSDVDSEVGSESGTEAASTNPSQNDPEDAASAKKREKDSKPDQPAD